MMVSGTTTSAIGIARRGTSSARSVERKTLSRGRTSSRGVEVALTTSGSLADLQEPSPTFGARPRPRLRVGGGGVIRAAARVRQRFHALDVLAREERIELSGDDRTDERRHPEEPE